MDLTSHPSQTAVFIKLFPGLARIQFQHVGIPTRDLDWMWGRIQFKRLSGLMMQVSDGFLVWSSIFCSGWRISFQNVYMGWLLPTSVTSVGEYMGLGDGCCQHPSPLLVNTWNTWAWVTDVANIHHLCWWIHGIHGLGWRILPTSVTSVGEYVGLGDGCCQHPSPLLVKHCLGDGFCRHPSPLLVNMWAWVTDAGSIRHLVWSNIAWVTDFADYFVCVCVSPSFWCGKHPPRWRIGMTSSTQNIEVTYGFTCMKMTRLHSISSTRKWKCAQNGTRIHDHTSHIHDHLEATQTDWLTVMIVECWCLPLSVLSLLFDGVECRTPTLSYPVLSYPFLSCPTLSFRILSCPVLSYYILTILSFLLSFYLSIPIYRSIYRPISLSINLSIYLLPIYLST